MKLMRKLTRHNLRLNKLRTVVTVIGIVLSVALLTIVSVLGSSVRENYLKSSAQLLGNQDFQLALTKIDRKYVTEKTEKLSSNRNIEDVFVYTDVDYGKFDGSNAAKPFLNISAISAGGFDKCFSVSLSHGRYPEKTDEILLPDDVNSLSGKKYSVGDKLTFTPYDIFFTEDLDPEKLNDPEYEKIEDSNYNDVVFKKRGDTITYTITGFYSGISDRAYANSYGPQFDAFTVYDPVFIPDTPADGESGSYCQVYVLLTDEARKNYVPAIADIFGLQQKDINQIISYSAEIKDFGTVDPQMEYLIINNYLMDIKNVSLTSPATIDIYGVLLVMIVIIMSASVFIIKNSFAISITEKTKLYGMLSAVGATPRQIRLNVIYEGMILGAFGIPIGLGVGILTAWLLITISEKILIDSLNGMTLIFSISWMAIAASVLLGLLTIILSSLFSAFKASRISPIEAIRSNNDVKVTNDEKKINYKTPKYITKIFGTGGKIAWKNSKRSKKKYRTTVISIVVSVAVYLTSFSFVNDTMIYADGLIDDTYNMFVSDSRVISDYKTSGGSNFIDDSISKFKTISSFEEVEKSMYYIGITGCYKYRLPEEKMNKRLYEINGVDIEDVKKCYFEVNLGTTFCVLDDDSFKEMCSMSGYDYNTVKDKAFFVNRIQILDKENGSDLGTEKLIDSSKGMEISGDLMSFNTEDGVISDAEDSLPKAQAKYPEADRTLHITVADDVPANFMNKHMKNNSITYDPHFFVSMDWFRKNIQDRILSDYDPSTYIFLEMNPTISLNSTDDAKTEENIHKLDNNSGMYINNTEDVAKRYRAMMLIVQIFVYGFIIVMSMIGLTNIFNSVTSNMNLRRKEFAMLRSVGMTRREFNRMIRLESIMYTTKSLLIGLPLGIAGGYLVNVLFNQSTDTMPYHFPWLAVLISILVVLLTIILIMDFSIRKVRNQNIIETIRNDNI